MGNAIVQRCRMLEDQLAHATSMHLTTPEFLQLSSFPAGPKPGLFAQMLSNRYDVQVGLSSLHACMNYTNPQSVLEVEKSLFGTQTQSESNQPWIEITSQLHVCPRSVGLKHGWNEGDMCKCFVI